MLSAAAVKACAFFPATTQSRQAQAREHGDHGDDNQNLDEGKILSDQTVGISFSAGVLVKFER